MYYVFDKLSYREAALRIHVMETPVNRRSKKIILDVGRMMFGFEDEFWKLLNND